MMLDILRLLTAVHAAPHEDAPRLVLADWLQERGEPWGEFIAVQCKLMHELGPTEARAKLLRREHALLETRSQWWPYDGQGFVVKSFARGFPRAIRAENVNAARTLSKQRPWVPDVEDLEIPLIGGDFFWLAASDRLPTCGLTLEVTRSAPFRNDDAHQFSNWIVKTGMRLRRFGLRGSAHGIALASLFEGVRGLEDVELSALETSPLRRLAIRRVSFDGFSVALAESLEDVELSSMMLERRAPDIVMRLTNVRHLDLASTGLDEVGLGRLLERAPSSMRGLNVGFNRIGDAAVELLAARSFERLDIAGNGLTGASARFLLESKSLPPSLVLTVSADELGPHVDALRERFAVVHTR